MPADDARQKDLEDLEVKLQDARRAAEAPGATEREKSDLKMMEQEYLAAQQKARHPGKEASKPAPGDSLEKKMDKKLDAALKDSFPGSDPVSFVEAAPEKQDHALPEVKAKDQAAKDKTSKKGR